jgi:hypothetical protein
MVLFGGYTFSEFGLRAASAAGLKNVVREDAIIISGFSRTT